MLLPDQDRSRWDPLLIVRGRAALERAEELPAPLGPYGLQAAIAACHARALRAEDTDWVRIAALYEALSQLTPSPVVELNRAVALGMAFGPEAGLELVETIAEEPALREYHLLPSVRGDLLAKLGREQEAAAEFRRAAELTAQRSASASCCSGGPRRARRALAERARSRPSRGAASSSRRAALGAEAGVELERRLVPVQRAPLQPHVAALERQRRQVLHHQPADAAAAVLRPHVDVLEPDPGTALEGREGRVEDRVADRLAAASSTISASAAPCSNSERRSTSASPSTSSASFS